MAVVQLLQLLLTLHFLVTSVSAGTNINRQLDIPAFKEFFPEVSSQRAKDDERTKKVIEAVVSGEPEGLKPSPHVGSNMEVNSTSIKSENPFPAQDPKFEAELNHETISREAEFRNIPGYQQASSGSIRGGFFPSSQVSNTDTESKGQYFDFQPMSKGSSSGSILLNSPTPGGTAIKNIVLGEKLESFQVNQPISILPLHSRSATLKKHPISSSVIHASKAASARSIPIQAFTNTSPTNTANTNDWIPISPLIQFPFTPSNFQTVTSKPPRSNGIVIQTTTSNPSGLTLKKQEEYKAEAGKNKTKGQVQLGSSFVTASNGTIGEVDNDSNPSFFRGIRFRKPSKPLYGQVLYPSRKYPRARQPKTKHVYKAPTLYGPPTSVSQVIKGGVGANLPAQPVHYPGHPEHKPTYQPNPPPSNEQFKPNVNSYPAPVNSGHTVSENGLYGKENGKNIANVDYPNLLPPPKNGVTNIEFSNPFTPISPDPPALRQLNSPNHGNSQPSPVQNFEGVYADDIGTVSSFSYFRNLESEISGSKGFDNAFSIHAGRNIAKQFKQNMFDQTGFPGNGQGPHTNREYGTGRAKY